MCVRISTKLSRITWPCTAEPQADRYKWSHGASTIVINGAVTTPISCSLEVISPQRNYFTILAARELSLQSSKKHIQKTWVTISSTTVPPIDIHFLSFQETVWCGDFFFAAFPWNPPYQEMYIRVLSVRLFVWKQKESAWIEVVITSHIIIRLSSQKVMDWTSWELYLHLFENTDRLWSKHDCGWYQVAMVMQWINHSTLNSIQNDAGGTLCISFFL